MTATIKIAGACAVLATTVPLPALAEKVGKVEIGVRPAYLVGLMEDGPLKDKLTACLDQEMKPSTWSIGHRGAQLQFPEHTVEANIMAARQGAGILECDVTFTSDKELVCRHAQDDLHRTTNILATDLADKCTQGFTPAAGEQGAAAECRTSDITLDEFRGLKAKMDAADETAASVEEYMNGTANWRTDLYAGEANTLMTHAESIELFKSLGTKFTPELKEAVVDMPFDGFTQEDYAQKLIDEYKAAGIPASDVFAQSFSLDDVLYWIEAEPEFGKQAVYLIEPDSEAGFDNQDPATWDEDFEDLHARGVNYLAPPLWVLFTVEGGELVESAYSKAAKEAGLKLITWSFERSGPLSSGGGWYYQTAKDWLDSDGKAYEILDLLAQDVGVEGVFSDWPATTTFYANCMGL